MLQNTKINMLHEKQHCCCCVPLPEGVMLVGVYGTSFHVGLLSIQLAYNHATLIPSPTGEVQYATSHIPSWKWNDFPSNPSLIIPYSAAEALAQTSSSTIVDKEVVEIVHPLLLVAHSLGIIVNLLLGKVLMQITQSCDMISNNC